MKNAFAAVAAATLVLGGCASSESNRDLGKSSDPSSLSSLDMKLTTPEGIIINSLDYTVTGGGLTSSRNATVNLANSTQPRFQVGNLPIANGYNIALAATALRPGGGTTPCAGTSPFNITNNAVNTLSMPLVCGDGTNTVDRDDNGDLRVTVTVEIRDGVVCPVVTGISALPLETAVGSSVQLEGFTSSAGGTVAWTGTGGAFAAAASAATAFTCATPGDHDLTFTVTRGTCTPSAYSVPVTCTGTVTPPDAGLPDATPPDAEVPDAIVTLPDAEVPDAIVTPPDADVPDAIVTPPDAAVDTCQTCVTAATSPCRDYQASGDFVAGCLENADPVAAEECAAVYNCSIRSADRCAADPTGIVKCFCGATPIDTCFAPGATPAGNCQAQIYAATDCATGALGCVEARIADPTYPSFNAQYLTICTASVADGCGASCPLPRP